MKAITDGFRTVVNLGSFLSILNLAQTGLMILVVCFFDVNHNPIEKALFLLYKGGPGASLFWSGVLSAVYLVLAFSALVCGQNVFKAIVYTDFGLAVLTLVPAAFLIVSEYKSSGYFIEWGILWQVAIPVVTGIYAFFQARYILTAKESS